MATVTGVGKPGGLRPPTLAAVGVWACVTCLVTVLLGQNPSWLAGVGFLGLPARHVPVLMLCLLQLAVAAISWRRGASPLREGAGWRALCGAVLLGVPLTLAPFFADLGLPVSGVAVPVLALVAAGQYPLAYSGTLALLRPRGHGLPAGAWLDGVVVAATLGALGTSAVPSGGWHEVGFGVVAALAGPVLGGVLLLVLVAAAVAVRSPGTDAVLAMVAVAGWSGAQLLVGDPDRTVTRPMTESLVLQVLAAAALGAAAVLGPGSGGGTDPPRWGVGATVDRTAAAGLSWSVIALPGVSTITCASLLALAQSTRMNVEGRVMAAAGLVVALLRVVLSLRSVQRLSDAHLQARTDDLTGLGNRRSIYEHCDRMIGSASSRHPVALLLLDLDRFKEVNDALGHVAGDLLLSQVGRRIAKTLRPADIAARLGGDEFAVLMPDTGAADAHLLAERVLHALSRPFTLETVTVHVEASVGVVDCPASATTRSEALRCADVAMYQAKRARSRVAVYARQADDPDRLRTVEELRSALTGKHAATAGSILVLYQPQVDLTTGLPCGVEALIRWQHPVRGLLAPGAFLPVAHAAALMETLTDVVCDLAVSACSLWWSMGVAVPVSINFPSSAVHDHSLVDRMSELLERYRLPPEAITLEITEDMLMNDPPLARAVLKKLRALGVAVSVDDYGTGYSSLAYLRHLPVDELKLDRVFIQDLIGDSGAAAIVAHVVSLAHSLGLRLVAEGIDDYPTVQMLAELGCDVGQGFYFARPMPAEQLLNWLTADAVALRPLVVPGLRAEPEERGLAVPGTLASPTQPVRPVPGGVSARPVPGPRTPAPDSPAGQSPPGRQGSPVRQGSPAGAGAPAGQGSSAGAGSSVGQSAPAASGRSHESADGPRVVDPLAAVPAPRHGGGAHAAPEPEPLQAPVRTPLPSPPEPVPEPPAPPGTPAGVRPVAEVPTVSRRPSGQLGTMPVLSDPAAGRPQPQFEAPAPIERLQRQPRSTPEADPPVPPPRTPRRRAE